MEPDHATDGSEAWQQEWQQHTCWLRTVLLARLRDGLVADEVLQEVAVIAWRKRDQLTDSAKIAPWLYRIAIRQVQMFWRSQARQRERVKPLGRRHELQVDCRQLNPLTWITTQEAHQQVRDAMKCLSNQDREILMLKHTEDWTYQQIASHLGISMDKVVYRLGRARERLRQQISRIEIGLTK